MDKYFEARGEYNGWPSWDVWELQNWQGNNENLYRRFIRDRNRLFAALDLGVHDLTNGPQPRLVHEVERLWLPTLKLQHLKATEHGTSRTRLDMNDWIYLTNVLLDEWRDA